MPDKEIGEVVHFYPKILVVVLKLKKGDLKIGDSVKLANKNGGDFIQTVESMQIEHAAIDIAKAGDEFGLMVDQEVKEKTKVFKVQ